MDKGQTSEPLILTMELQYRGTWYELELETDCADNTTEVRSAQRNWEQGIVEERTGAGTRTTWCE
jgi:hypothetical protein